MVEEQDLVRRVFHALAEAIPEEGEHGVTGVDIREGWGGVFTVTIFHAANGHGPTLERARAIREAVEQAIEPARHNVRLEAAAV